MFVTPDAALQTVQTLLLTLFALVVSVSLSGSLALLLFYWFKHRAREKYALDFVTLLVRLPKTNEIKIDAAEQMFSGLYALKHTEFMDMFKPEDMFSFEIVALKEDIAFYVNCNKRVRDLIEKQINGAYPDAEITEVDEVNIFSEKGRVAFAALQLERANYFPIKTFKELPTDGLSLITSALSKMQDGEGAMLQVLIQPESSRWQSAGYSYMQKEKKREADPEKATYRHDPKKMEMIDGKISKPGFRVAIRVVVSSPNEYSAKSHVSNIVGAFSQFASSANHFKKARIFLKHNFMTDCIYRYMPHWPWKVRNSLKSQLPMK
jgi:hypothetical protein